MPSTSPADREWSSTGTASRRVAGSSDGPLGTAHERSTSPTLRRKSKCSVVASCSWTTKRDGVAGGAMPSLDQAGVVREQRDLGPVGGVELGQNVGDVRLDGG